LYDLANIYKNFKKYEKAIEYYSIVLSKLDNNSSTYADVLYRRGGSFERIGQYDKSDADLLRSLEIIPDDPYTANYLAYSWLERNFNIVKAIEMLELAYKNKKNDPYITDSIGWGYYIMGDYNTSEKYLKKALELMPYDPIIHDHYGDVLWQLNRKIQAKYFWESVLDLEDAEEKMKKDIKFKLLNGPNKI
jgi:tetratricopeptide (TPR) repeat protein